MSRTELAGHWLLESRDKSIIEERKLRRSLSAGDSEAFFDMRGTIIEIPKHDWTKATGRKMLDTGLFPLMTFPDEDGIEQPLDPDPDLKGYNIFIKNSTSRDITKRIDTAKRTPFESDGYLSPFMIMMIEGSKKFDIGNTYKIVGKDEIIEYFQDQMLSEHGPKISESQAKHMATFIRPVEAMKGGQKKRKG